MAMLKPIEWTGTAVRIIDQTRLPTELRYEELRTVEEMHDAIRRLKVRGAPLIGISAAYGVCLAAQSHAVTCGTRAELTQVVNRAADFLASSRPTAVNLFWALKRMTSRAASLAAVSGTVDTMVEYLLQEAAAILEEDIAMGRAIGEHGLGVLEGARCLHTHCNAGGLATGRFGTALAPVYVALERGIRFEVVVDETRPLLQGARITAFELAQAGVPVTLICDSMAATVMAQGKVDAVIVGADRIAANGDVANKIGTYALALIAHAHGVPFYVAAPSTTLDSSLENGSAIPIEQREPEEITAGFGRRTAPDGVRVYNPAFDITPARLVTAIITERGVFRPPYDFRRV